MTLDSPLYHWLRAVGYGALLGATTGGLVGLAESSLAAVLGLFTISLPSFLPLTVFYFIAWGAVGAAIGAVVGGWVLLVRRRGSIAHVIHLLNAIIIPLILLVVIGELVNYLVLPRAASPPSLAFDAALLVVCILLGRFILRAGRRRATSGTGTSPFRTRLASACAILVILTAAAAIIPLRQPAEQQDERTQIAEGPSVLLLVADALRPDHLGCYGYERDTSPSIDSLAEDGVVFENAYANAPSTKPSTASFVTSLYPSTLGLYDFYTSLPESAPTLMQEMAKAGYRTAVLSANSFISPLMGFGRDVDYFYYRAPRLTSKTALGRGARMMKVRVPATAWFSDTLEALAGRLPRTMGNVVFRGAGAGIMNEEFLSWIDGDPDAPFFAYVHYMETHTPYNPTPPYDTAFMPDEAGPVLTDFPKYSRGLLPFRTAAPISERDRESLIGQYDGAIAALDNEIGHLIDELESRDLLDRALVVVTADHGDEFHEHKAWGHGHSLHEEVIRVPLIYRLPGARAGGRRVSGLASHVDLMPTILGAAGSPAAESEGLAGSNLWSIIVSGEEIGREPIMFAEHLSGQEYTGTLREFGEKVIYTSYEGKQSIMLFDLTSDPGEQHNLEGERPQVAAALASKLFARREELLSTQRITERKVMDAEALEQLRALGYIR